MRLLSDSRREHVGDVAKLDLPAAGEESTELVQCGRSGRVVEERDRAFRRRLRDEGVRVEALDVWEAVELRPREARIPGEQVSAGWDAASRPAWDG